MLRGAYADNSNRVYTAAHNAYRQFACTVSNVNGTVGDLDDVSLFIAYLSYQMFSPNTIITYTSAICQELKQRNGLDLGGHFLVKRLLKCVKKDRSCDLRLPISMGLLHKLNLATVHVCTSCYEATLFACIFNLAFHGLFRISELVATRQSSPSILLYSHISIIENNVATLNVKVVKSKTDQFSRSCNVVLHKQPDEHARICPIVSVTRYMSLRPATFATFFVHADGRVVTSSQCNHVLQLCLKYLNINDSARYSSHSFRIGGCTHLSKRGVSEEALKMAGRWRSDAYKKYIRQTTIIPLT